MVTVSFCDEQDVLWAQKGMGLQFMTIIWEGGGVRIRSHIFAVQVEVSLYMCKW